MSIELKKITYVEDEPDIRAVAEIALTTIGGFSLDVCCSGTEALSKAPGFQPDLVLLDVMMPGIDGVETFRQLKSMPETQNIPVIFMTAKAQRHEVQEYKDHGAIDVIVKPFDPITLSDQISTIWNRYREEEAGHA